MTFQEEILEDIMWRQSELALLKILPVKSKLQLSQRNAIIKYIVPCIYALWEGFVKNSFRLYVNEINREQLHVEKVHINLLTHTLTSDKKLTLENPRTNFNKKKEFIIHYQNSILRPLHINASLPTKSNINFEIINDLLTRFNLQLIDESYQKPLDKFLRFRNTGAHGDNSIPVNMDNIHDFSELVLDLMERLYDILNHGFITKSYLSESITSNV